MQKTILITGAAVNLGAAIANMFAQKEWNIIINYNHSETQATKLTTKLNAKNKTNSNTQAIAIKADVTKQNQVEKMFDTARHQFQNIDVVINNAGLYPARNSLQNIELQQWNDALNLNLTAGMLTAKQMAKHATTESRIINIASIGGTKIFKNRIDYNVSKAAMIRLTAVLAKELAPLIAVNCVCPGIVDLGHPTDNIPPKNTIPMQRYAAAEDVCAAVYFFATGPHYITGQTLHVAGGLEL